MKFPIVIFIIITISNALIAQDPVQFETNLTITGQVTLGQDDTQTPAKGMIRFDTITNLFLVYNGESWINLGAAGGEVNTQTNTLEVGDAFGGGIVFHTVGSNGLVVTDFDLVDPNNLLNKDIRWGENGITDATSPSDGKQNTIDIIEFAESDNWSSDVYAAKLCDTLVLEVYEDRYLPFNR